MFVKRPINQPEIHSFWEELIVLLNNITLHCYRHLVQLDRSVWERVMWFFIHLVGASFLGLVIYNAWENFTATPLVTTLHDTLYPISRVPFPAVSICNNNRISKRAAMTYAEYLNARDQDESKNTSYYLERIRLLGHLYSYSVDNKATAIEVFQEFLDIHDSDSNITGFHSILERMMQLTPKCEDIMVRCFWETVKIPCMLKNHMMETRKTSYGFCCTYNYVSRMSETVNEEDPYYSEVTGPVMGLMVVVNGSSDDYFYSIHNSAGFIVQIFSPNEFPDITNGAITEKFVQLGTETFIRIDAITLRSEPIVAHYALDKRECLFPHEYMNKYGGTYSRSNCITNCRVNSVIALCDCIPFTLPIPSQFVGSSIATCSLQHIECLNKYKIKWVTVVNKIHKIIGLEKEMEESLYCPECKSACSNSKYEVTLSDLPLIKSRRVSYSLTTGLKNITDLSVIRVFFGQPETWLYKQDVAYQWFEIFSNFGGMFGIMAGCSLISLTEIVFFLLKQMLRAWGNCSNLAHHKHGQAKQLKIYP